MLLVIFKPCETIDRVEFNHIFLMIDKWLLEIVIYIGYSATHHIELWALCYLLSAACLQVDHSLRTCLFTDCYLLWIVCLSATTLRHVVNMREMTPNFTQNLLK